MAGGRWSVARAAREQGTHKQGAHEQGTHKQGAHEGRPYDRRAGSGVCPSRGRG